ncbi:MAG: hypothetical protein F7C38_07295 [Desulfurococcales archaeon]|nr:hypothetical protein [Desulfurococcales archaeon]
MSIWSPQPLINTVYETLLALSKNGEIPVSEADVIAELKRRGEDISRRDLAKILMTLEILGYISTQLSKKELIVKVNAKR